MDYQKSQLSYILCHDQKKDQVKIQMVGENLSQPSENQLKTNPDECKLLPSIFRSKYLAVNCAEDKRGHFTNTQMKAQKSIHEELFLFLLFMLLEIANGLDLIQIIYIWCVMHDMMCLQQICLSYYVLLYC